MERERLIERERARIAHDLHDDLGTGLTEIHTTSALGLDPSVPADEAQDYFREISHRAQEMVSALDEIVWAVNPRNDNLGSLTSYFCHFAEHFLKPTGITCRFDVQEHLPDVRLASNQRHSLFLAFKEALNNAVRHSQAENVTIRLSVADSALRLSVTDDGCGFASVPDHPGADGLTGMCDRLTHLGGQGTISSSPGRGTVITFVLPLRSGASEAGLRS
jgi:signal transduction histidine kinase